MPLSVRVLVYIAFFLSLLPFLKPVGASENNLIAEINQFRQSNGLASASTNSYTCSFASLRAKEAAADFSHTSFYNRVTNKTLPYPYYRVVTENLAWAPNNQDPVQMWLNSPPHKANLLKKTSFICVAKHGDYFALEGWGH